MNQNYTSVFVDREVSKKDKISFKIETKKSPIKQVSLGILSLMVTLLLSFSQISFGQIENQKSVETEASSQNNFVELSINDSATTSLRADFCGATVDPIDNIYPQGIVGATGYKFNIYNSTGTMLVASIENSYSRFRFAQLNYEFNTTYQVKVQVKVGGAYGEEGAACSVTTNPIPVTTVSPAHCGTTVSYLDKISPVGVFGATGYNFNIYDASGTTLIASVENAHSYFKFIQFPFEFNTTYQVKVQVRSGSSLGEEGAACAITSQSIPTTSLIDSQCNEIVYTVDRIYPISVVGADGYRFNIYDQSGTTLLASVDNVGWFKFSEIEYLVGAHYTIKIQVKFGSLLSEEGSGCVVRLLDISPTKIIASQCGQTVGPIENIYPIGIPGADGYIFNIYDADGTTLIASLENPESRFRCAQINFDFNETYQVKVRVKRGTFVSAEGEACLLTLSDVPTTTIRASQCGATVHANDNIFPIGVTGATGYIFNIYDASGTYFIASIQNPYSRFRFSQLDIDRNTTYKVTVQVVRGTSIGVEGAACDITLSSGSSEDGLRQGVVSEKTGVAFGAVAYPNPFTEDFKLSLNSLNDATIQVQVYDMVGKLLENRTISSSDIQNFQLGKNLSTGVYNVIVSQGSEVQTVRVIKR